MWFIHPDEKADTGEIVSVIFPDTVHSDEFLILPNLIRGQILQLIVRGEVAEKLSVILTVVEVDLPATRASHVHFRLDSVHFTPSFHHKNSRRVIRAGHFVKARR